MCFIPMEDTFLGQATRENGPVSAVASPVVKENLARWMLADYVAILFLDQKFLPEYSVPGSSFHC